MSEKHETNSIPSAEIVKKEEHVLTEFSSDNMSVVMKQAPHCRVMLDITVSPAATQAAYKKAVKKINKEISVPGFRKGKAPESLVIKNYASHVDEQWRDTLLNTSFNESMKLTGVYPFSDKSIRTAKVESSSMDDGAVVVFEYESEPQVPTIECEQLTLKKVDPAIVDDATVDARIEQLCDRYAEWEEFDADYTAKAGDYVNLTIVSLEDKDEGNNVLCENSRFRLDEAEMSPWLITLVTGLKKGESAEGVSEADERLDDDARKEFIPTKCKVTVVSISHRVIPAVDETFAKKLGCDTIEILRENVYKQCEGESGNEVKEELRRQVESAVLEKYDFDLPSSLIESERKIRIKNRIRELKAQKKTAEEIAALEKDIENEVAKEVSSVLRFYFLVRSVARDNRISVSDEEISKEISRERIYWYLFHQGEEFNEHDPEMRSRLHASILTTKVKDFLIDKIEIV